ncbi:hypothetical protein ACFS5N_14900 [Mucilaginibacter ximonensis]|uniref:Uncharacterized protein n=1 Tax=Mucilaginibacter ximonensis TaxID=538021 RepID=A0ABW5YES7_9SPHI
MKQLEVFNKIGGILKELNEQYQYIQADPENINDLEMELFVANAHFLTDHAEILNKLNQRSKAQKAEEAQADKVGTKADSKLPPRPAAVELPERNFELPVKPVGLQKPAEQPEPELVKSEEPLIVPEPQKIEEFKKLEEPEKVQEPVKTRSFVEKFFEPVVRPIKPKPAEPEQPAPVIDLSAETPKDSYTFIMEPPEVIRHELEIDPDDNFADDEDIADTAPIDAEREEITPEPLKAEAPKPEVKEQPQAQVKIEPKPAEKKEESIKNKEDVLTINERMSAQRGGSTHHTEQAAQPVTNLKAAITLNDKLIFIKDLFNGYSLAYSEAIEILNRFNTFEEANRFLTKNYTTKNNWESKPETAEKFFALLKRRYA